MRPSLYERDALTGLETRFGFIAHVDDLIETHPFTQYVLVCIDVDRFCAYNARFGHDAGDELLAQIGTSLSSMVPQGSAVARLYADRFALFVSRGYFNEAELLDRLSRDPGGAFCSIRLGIYEVRKSPSLSVADMLDCAHLALRAAARKTYGSRSCSYRESMRDEAILYLDIVREFSSSTQSGSITPCFQPIVSCLGERIAGVEALARWDHPVHGRLSPSLFVPVLEEAGLIAEHDMNMIVQSLASVRNWIDAGIEVVPVSVNVSRAALSIQDLAQKLKSFLYAYRLPSCLLRLEISEKAWATDPAQLKHALSALQDAGFSIAVDDFGTGSTSLGSLENAPIDVVKLDMSFLKSRIPARGEIVVESVVRLAHDLGLVVVVEGVETEDQAAFLKSVGVDLAQGYLYAPPLDEPVFRERLSGGGRLIAKGVPCDERDGSKTGAIAHGSGIGATRSARTTTDA